ncbi:MAG: nucleotide sugar dehydrogenase [Colwellia sp.]|jgi:nucleotide sugar dehydrogenase
MKVSIFGLGYVGLTSAACSLREGHQVVGVDVSNGKVDAINNGECPIFEPGLPELIAEGQRSGNLTASTKIGEHIAYDDIAIVCVGTPSLANGSHNMTYIAEVTRQLAEALAKVSRAGGPLAIVYRSTIRPGTLEKLIKPIMERYLKGEGTKYELVYNPEFLRESTAIKDYFSPPKIVIGTESGEPSKAVDELYKNIDAPRFYTRFAEAEMTKFVDNTFHAVKVAFANEIGRVAQKLGVSASKIHEIFIADTKLNISPYYLRPGGAFGGSCLPKDVRALINLSGEGGANTHLIDSLMRSNDDHKRFLFDTACSGLKSNAKILLNGIAFKANSDDLRESPLLDMAERIVREGYSLEIFDPNVKIENLRGANLGYTLAMFPSLADFVVNDKELPGRHYDLIIDGRGNADSLDVTAERIFDATKLA